MAQKPPASPDTELDDALNLAFKSVASMSTQGSGAMTDPLDSSIHPASHNDFNQPTRPSAMPLPSPNATTALPYHGAHHNSVNAAQSNVEAGQVLDPADQSDNHGEPEVEIPLENSQKDGEIPQLEETAGADAVIAEPQDEVSSEDLSGADVSDGHESLMSPESEDDLDRADRYAFSYAGQAYDHGVPQHLTGGTTLFAKKVTQGITIRQHLESAEKQGNSNECPSLTPHELEMKRTAKAVECIWVGMLPNPQGSRTVSASAQPESQADAAPPSAQDGGDDAAEAQLDGTSKAPKVQKRAKKCQRIIDLEDDQLNIIPHAPNALRVVAKKQTKAIKTWHLYALTTSDNNSKLCQGWKVHSEEVFFFKAFRDDTVPGILKRKQASDIKIKAVIFPPDVTPALVPKSSSPAERSASHVSAPVTPTPGGLPSPKPSGRKEKASCTVRDVTTKQASKAEDVLGQDGDDAGSPVPSVENGGGSGADNQSTAGNEPKELNTASLETDQPEPTGTIYDDGDEDAYPEHAVSATSPSYKNFLNEMLRGFSGVESIGAKRGEKRKRVAFEPSCDGLANTRRKTDARDGLEREDSASFVVQRHTDHLVRKLTSMIDNLVMKQDVAGLRQCATMVESIEKRSCPSPTSALAPYLNLASKKDATPRACCGKLREILVSLPFASFIFSFSRTINANYL